MVEEQTVEVTDRPRLFGRLAWYRRRIETLEQQAVVDDLTGLRNQRALWRELSRRVAACSPSSPLAVVMLDFDLFKEVNEDYGHAVGDAVLRRGAAVLRAAAPSPRLAFRYGGEEFVLISGGGEDDARELAERVRAELAAQNGALPAVTASCGVAEVESPVEPWVVLDRADSALREAKRAGRNRVVAAGRPDPAVSPYLVGELESETARRAALALAVATLQVRDRETADHSDDVLTLCEAIGRRLDFDERALQHLKAGAQLHDVGKVAVPLAILNKPGPLTEPEWSLIREHTVVGERILRSVPEMAEVATVVRHSHEHWDGSGYPDGLSGDQIPLASRVILCADAFHAIRCDRPYRRGRSARDALKELRMHAGTQFDPTVVEALADVATEAHDGRAAVTIGPRNRRLVVLLTTLVVGGGSAVAAIPEVREALKSVFGTSVPPTMAAPADPGAGGFDFGPLGELLVLPPAAKEQGKAERRRASSSGRREERRRGRPAPPAANGPGAGFGATGGVRSPGGGDAVQSEPRASVPERHTPAGHDAQPPPDTGTSGGDGGGTTPAPRGNGRGRALGRSVPTPRPPVQSPSEGRGGRTDPPALGLNAGPAPQGKAKGLSK